VCVLHTQRPVVHFGITVCIQWGASGGVSVCCTAACSSVLQRMHRMPSHRGRARYPRVIGVSSGDIGSTSLSR